MTDEEVVAATIREIGDYLPDAAEAKVEHAVVNRIPMAIHCPYPGTEALRLPVRTAVEGLVLAGDWIKTGLPLSMESATMAGFMAAEAILEDVGRPASLVVPHPSIEGLSPLVRWAAKLLPVRPATYLAERLPSDAGIAAASR